VLSPHSEKSKWVKGELNRAFQYRSDRIIPVIIADCDPWRFHLLLDSIQSADFRENRREALEKVLKSLGIAPTRPFEPPVANPSPPRPVADRIRGGDSGEPARSVAKPSPPMQSQGERPQAGPRFAPSETQTKWFKIIFSIFYFFIIFVGGWYFPGHYQAFGSYGVSSYLVIILAVVSWETFYLDKHR
jgi:hypothetical protein